MKKRARFVSNSSSSSFLILNPPNISTIDELIDYLKYIPTEDEKDDFNCILTLFQGKKHYTKSEIIRLLVYSLELGVIPFFDKLCNETFEKSYHLKSISFLLNEYNDKSNDEFDENIKLLNKPIIKQYIKYMWLYSIEKVINSCYETQKNFIIKQDRKNNQYNRLFRVLANSIYDKLKEDGLLNTILVFDVGTDHYPTVESGVYFKNVDTIIRISNH